MIAEAVKATLTDIQSFRALFLQESNFQIRYNACHERGWSDSYLLKVDGIAVGYGSIKGQEIPSRDTVFEFFIVPAFRNLASALFRELVTTSGARFIECQSNDRLLPALLYEFSRDIRAEVVLFDDHVTTEHRIPGAVVRRRRDDDRIFEHAVEPVGDYVVETDDEIVATAGFMLHYNMPFADLYMEVRQNRRRRGYGTLVLQEVKKACYLAGRVPAARCHIRNEASRATLMKAGMRVCGFMLMGTIEAGRDGHRPTSN
jgi:RimJ/RimL family protein N-acetyltransferase